jgi:death on curing protein
VNLVNHPIIWVRVDTAIAAHAEQLRVHGGKEGLRDRGLLEGAMMRAQMKSDYGVDDMAALAAAYGFGIARNHPFVDGNKRTALVVMETFLGLNGYQLASDNVVLAALILELAAGEITEEELAEWVRGDLQPFEEIE